MSKFNGGVRPIYLQSDASTRTPMGTEDALQTRVYLGIGSMEEYDQIRKQGKNEDPASWVN